MTLRERVSLNPLGKPLPPKLAHRADPEIIVAQGNHRWKGRISGERLDDGSIEILHFLMRSYGQFENKIVKGGRAYGRNRRCHSARAGRGGDCTKPGRRGGCATTTTPTWSPRGRAPDLVEDTRLRDFLRALRRGASCALALLDLPSAAREDVGGFPADSSCRWLISRSPTPAQLQQAPAEGATELLA